MKRTPLETRSSVHLQGKADGLDQSPVPLAGIEVTAPGVDEVAEIEIVTVNRTLVPGETGVAPRHFHFWCKWNRRSPHSFSSTKAAPEELDRSPHSD